MDSGGGGGILIREGRKVRPVSLGGPWPGGLDVVGVRV